jgi:hypothetical protein
MLAQKRLGRTAMLGVALVSTGRTTQDVIWLDNNFTINLGGFTDQTLNEARELPIGSTLITPPVAVVSGSMVHVFGVGPDHGLYHWVCNSAAPFGSRWSTPELVGINFWSTPAAVLSGANQIDLFGLGPERGMLHTRWNGSKWSTWEQLGGAFSSLPVVLPSATGFDIFARGLDYLIYHVTNWKPGGGPANWEKLGGGLFGEPVAASAPAAVRLTTATLIFVTGADGTIWYTAFDGKLWKAWLSLGLAQHTVSLGKDPVTFISEPVPVRHTSDDIATGGGGAEAGPTTSANPVASQPPPFSIASGEHIDVFAVGSDNALWQKRLDHDGWHPSGDWSSLGGSFACAPSIVAWVPRSTVATHIPPAHFSLVAPQTDNTIHRWSFDPTPTSVSSAGTWSADDNVSHPTFGLPTRYTFTVQNIHIDSIRSPSSDTDHGVATLKIGGWPLRSVSFNFGDLSAGDHVYDWDRLGFVGTVELCEQVIYIYSIVNNHETGPDQVIETIIVKAIEDSLNDLFKSKMGPLGSLYGAAFAWLGDQLLSIAFGGCDGLVAAGSMAYLTGRDVQEQMLQQGSGTPRQFLTSTRSELGNPPTTCQNSNYLVVTSITQT